MKINKRQFITYVLCFIILIYPFNSTLKSRFFPNEGLWAIICGIALILLLLIGLGKNKKIYKKQLLILFITLIILGIQLNHNYYFKESSEAKVIWFSIYIFLPFVLSINNLACSTFLKVSKFFCIEHICGTFFVQIFKQFYMNNILPWLSNGRASVALSNLKNGYNPGITMHYSTNGIYLSISTILFFSEYLENKKKSSLIFTILSIIALLLTGKRAHTLFTILACVILYLYKYKEKTSKKIFNFIIVATIGIIGIMIMSIFIPQVLNVVERFESTIAKGELLSGREPFYELALNLWSRHKLLGNGWGAFSYYFQIYIYSSIFTYGYLDAHNVYLQLLCETGIIGLCLFLFIALTNLKKNSKLIKITNDNSLALMFAFAYQLFFLLYCFSGNPLYDIQCYAIYFISMGIVLNVQVENEKKKNEVAYGKSKYNSSNI